jgi:hypothetical protein
MPGPSKQRVRRSHQRSTAARPPVRRSRLLLVPTRLVLADLTVGEHVLRQADLSPKPAKPAQSWRPTDATRSGRLFGPLTSPPREASPYRQPTLRIGGGSPYPQERGNDLRSPAVRRAPDMCSGTRVNTRRRRARQCDPVGRPSAGRGRETTHYWRARISDANLPSRLQPTGRLHRSRIPRNRLSPTSTHTRRARTHHSTPPRTKIST